VPQPITRRQYLNWKESPVSRKLRQELRALRQEALEKLAEYHRGKDEVPGDERLRGFIRAIDEVIDWEPEGLEGERE